MNRYSGSVKEVDTLSDGVAQFTFTDHYSVFDWGRMPDQIPGKGKVLGQIASHLFERLGTTEAWKDFSAKPEALSLRKGAAKFPRSPLGGQSVPMLFNELGEVLQKKGLKHHFIGRTGSPSQIQVKRFNVKRPTPSSIASRVVHDYKETFSLGKPKLIPIEWIFRFSAPQGSSLRARIESKEYFETPVGFQGLEGDWEFPVLECFTKLESTDRLLTLSEALLISGISAQKFQETMLRTAWVAGWLKAYFRERGLSLLDGKFEWGIDENEEIVLLDAIGPDELRIHYKGVDLSKEHLRRHYRKTDWFTLLSHAKESAKKEGRENWKDSLPEPSRLPKPVLNAAAQAYQALGKALTAHPDFSQAWSFDQVLGAIE